MPKQNPYLIENKKLIELVQEIEKYEIKKSPLSPAARSKVINKSGSNYVSESKEDYGPGNSQSSGFVPRGGRSITGYPSNHPTERYFRQQRERHRNEEFNRATLFVAETAIKATAATTLTTLTGGWAPFIGGGAWIGGEWLKSNSDEFLQFLGRGMSDLGGGMFSGGLFASSTVGEFARKSGIDLKKLENFFEIKGHAETVRAIAEHNRHKNEGKDYKSNCELCNL